MTPRAAGLAPRVLGGLVVAVAAATAWFVVRGAGVDGVGLARFLVEEGAPAYGLGIGWLVVAPGILLAALLLERRTPWPWVAVVTVHLAVLLALTLRLRHLVPGASGVALACFGLLGLASIAVVVADR